MEKGFFNSESAGKCDKYEKNMRFFFRGFEKVFPELYSSVYPLFPPGVKSNLNGRIFTERMNVFIEKTIAFFQKCRMAQTGYSTWSRTVLIACAACLAAACLLVWTVDPHYRYHMPLFYDTVYYELYATAPRFLKSEKYDLLMLGTSMTRNFFLNDINEAFGCQSVKLAASGGTMFDLKKFFDLAKAAKGGELKRVVFSLDIYSLNKLSPHWKEFSHLYREDFKEEYKYFFSRQTYSSMFYLMKRKLRPKKKRMFQTDRNRMFSTEYPGMRFGLQAVLRDAWHNEKAHHTQTPYIPASEKTLREQFLPIFDRNPDMHFTVYLPPYHIYTYCQSELFGESEALIRQRSAVMKELIKRPNVTLYDFQADPSYVCNHDYFSDVQHFSSHAARRVLRDLTGKRSPIRTEAQVLENEKLLRELIRRSMKDYHNDMQPFRKKGA